jgi:hypothetical protein
MIKSCDRGGINLDVDESYMNIQRINVFIISEYEWSWRFLSKCALQDTPSKYATVSQHGVNLAFVFPSCV